MILKYMAPLHQGWGSMRTRVWAVSQSQLQLQSWRGLSGQHTRVTHSSAYHKCELHILSLSPGKCLCRPRSKGYFLNKEQTSKKRKKTNHGPWNFLPEVRFHDTDKTMQHLIFSTRLIPGFPLPQIENSPALNLMQVTHSSQPLTQHLTIPSQMPMAAKWTAFHIREPTTLTPWDSCN